MGKIYLNQDSLRIQLTTEVDITGATVTQIKYKKPVSGDTDEVGSWTFWYYVTLADTRSAPGEPVKVTFYTEGE